MSIVLKSGSLNLLDASGPVQACNGIALLFNGCQRTNRLPVTDDTRFPTFVKACKPTGIRTGVRYLKNKRPTGCHLHFYFTSYVFNMFRKLIYPSSEVCDYSVELPHWSYCTWFDVCWSFGVVGLEWYPCCRLKPDVTLKTHPPN